MAVVLAVAALAALAAVAVVAADRFVVLEAERRAAEYLTTPLGTAALVRLHGRPFLSQALRGRYRVIEVTADHFRFGVLGDTALHAHLTNAYLPVRDLLGRRVHELPVEAVHGELLVPYRELARVSRIPGLRFACETDRLVATAALPVPGLSQVARVSGEALASMTDSGDVLVRIRNVSLAGMAVPGLVVNQVIGQLVPTLAFTVPLPPLPYGLRIDQLVPTRDGLRVSGSAQAVVFRRVPDPAP